MEVDRNLGDAVLLGVLDLRWMSALARSKELRGCRAKDGERGVDIDDGTRVGLLAEKDIERSDVGVDSSMTGGVP